MRELWPFKLWEAGGGERGHKLEIKHAQGGPRVVNKCCEL